MHYKGRHIYLTKHTEPFNVGVESSIGICDIYTHLLDLYLSIYLFKSN